MKKVIIPFSLTEYQKGGYEVETRSGLKVRIICSDQKCSSYPIVALTSDFCEDSECVCCYTIKGKYLTAEHNDSLDLFLFKTEFENGDVLYNERMEVVFILKVSTCYSTLTYCALYNKKGLVLDSSFSNFKNRIATEEEKQKLVQALASEGKYWNAEKKCIEDIKPKYDFQPFDKVLVRNFSDSKWMANFFRNYNDDDDTKFRYMCITGDYNQCLPYNDETKDLLCTTGNAPEKYKVW